MRSAAEQQQQQVLPLWLNHVNNVFTYHIINNNIKPALLQAARCVHTAVAAICVRVDTCCAAQLQQQQASLLGLNLVESVVANHIINNAKPCCKLRDAFMPLLLLSFYFVVLFSSKFTAADFQQWRGDFYTRLAAHMRRASDSIGELASTYSIRQSKFKLASKIPELQSICC
jgi:hypothetical protein